MSGRPLRIAWLGPAPSEGGGVPGVACELLDGLSALGHEIDGYFPSSGQTIPPRLVGNDRLTFNWGTSTWRWDRWYSRTRIMAFATGIFARGLASVRLRRQIMRRHRVKPYDVVYQFGNIESLAAPTRLTRTIPLVIHPETHTAGELRGLIAERRLGLRCHPVHRLVLVAGIMLLRSLIQRVQIRRARLLVCISGAFRDHLVRDYGFPVDRTVVVPNPVRLDRFTPVRKAVGEPPTILVLGRIAVRKGIQDVIALAKVLLHRNVAVRFRIIGGPSLWSDYVPLLEDLPGENAEYVGSVPASEVPAELARSDLLLQFSRYEPFGLTVAEALAAGIPVLATSEVGATEGVSAAVVAEVAPGDVEGMATATVHMLEGLAAEPDVKMATARSEAERLFAAEVVCRQISDALGRLLERRDS